METDMVLADQGQWVELGSGGEAIEARVLAVRRGSELVLHETQATFWLVIRGNAEVKSQEGHFNLERGDWLSLEGDARSSIEVGRDALVLGVTWPARPRESLPAASMQDIFIGRGTVPRRLLRRALRRWRAHANGPRGGGHGAGSEPRSLEPIFHLILDIQHELSSLIERTPGRSLRRRRQVFSRMQRACLYLEGHLDRAVRLAELAELSSFSVWYFTKTFHAIYGEGPQAAASRMRLQHAARLLSESRLSVGEVSAACGFENICSFSRAFRSRYGVPPSVYRQRVFTPDFVKSHDSHGKALGTFGP